MKTALVTGASSGIGFATCELLAAKGLKVYGAARRVDRMEPLRAKGTDTLRLDVTSEESMVEVVQTILADAGRIDVLVNNAGYGELGPMETVSMENAREQLEVNLFGAARLTQLVLPAMRKQGSGRIIFVSSIAGKIRSPSRRPLHGSGQPRHQNFHHRTRCHRDSMGHDCRRQPRKVLRGNTI